MLRTDKGKEFVNAASRKVLDEHDFEMRVSCYQGVICGIAECFKMTLKSKLYN